MLDTLIRDIGARFGLGDQARPLVQMVVAYITNPATGGLTGFLDKFRTVGAGSMVDSWLGNATAPVTPTVNQIESALGAGTGTGLLSQVASRLGLSADKVGAAVAALVPALISRLTPGGTIPSVLPAEYSEFAREGHTLLGLTGTGSAAAELVRPTTATPVPPPRTVPPVVEEKSGFAKWLPWLIAALVVIFGVSYCSKNKQEAVPPAESNVPAPSAPADTTPVAPAPAPETAPAPTAAAPVAPAADNFTAPEGAGVLDGVHESVPLLRVFFDTGKTEVAAEFADKSKPLVDYLQANPDVKAIVSGFNDPTGDPALNAELSKNRAEAVKAALLMAGVAADRVVLEKPAETTDTGATNAASRRVDVMLRKD